MNKKTIKVITAVFTALLVCVFALTAQAQTSTKDEGVLNLSDIYTQQILDKADIIVSENDKIIRTDGKGCIAITIVRAFEVKVDYRGQEFTVECTEGTVADAVKKAGITLTGAEEISPELTTPLASNMEITVSAQCGATVTIGGETETLSVTSGTVEDLLSDMGVVLSEDDVVYPSLTDIVYDGIEIVVQRVEYKEETTVEAVEYGYVSEETSSMLTGTSKIKQYGIDGEKVVVSKNKYVDGVLAETEIISEEVTIEPVDQIKLIGTGVPKTQSGSSSSSSSSGSSVSNKAGTFTDASGNTVSYTKKLTGSSTAYYAAEGAITATGVPVYYGGVAVNPDVIPYGSKLYIVSSDGSMVYGYATAVDTGGALMSGYVLVDVFYPTYNQCVNWGRRNVTVYVLS
ncbi:MAG: DUF348 domain-containing protein [Ruminococcus sp.]|nr:DUF348 domain-containing protein [Ruminococcus sp.]